MYARSVKNVGENLRTTETWIFANLRKNLEVPHLFIVSFDVVLFLIQYSTIVIIYCCDGIFTMPDPTEVFSAVGRLVSNVGSPLALL